MRLVCPNCKANYEIPPNAVPIGGREVKCDSCGHSWFQTRHKKTKEKKLTQPDIKIANEDIIEVESSESNKKKIDPSVIKILKEEAKREIEARDRERTQKNISSKSKKSAKNVGDKEPTTLTREAILKHQSKDALAEALKDKKSTLSFGFIFGLLLVLFALLVYLFGEQLIIVFPETEIYFVSYIGFIDEIRLELNKLAGRVTFLLTNLI